MILQQDQSRKLRERANLIPILVVLLLSLLEIVMTQVMILNGKASILFLSRQFFNLTWNRGHG